LIDRSAKLPRFARPPVIEVALSLQLEPLRGFRSVHYGLLADQWRERYPSTEDQPPLAPLVPEAEAELSAARVQVQLSTGAPLPRCWFVSRDQTRLVQVQPDRFAFNWRRLHDTDEYPHFDTLRPQFDHEFGVLERLAREHGLGDLRTLACEVTYVNAILAGEGWEHHGQLGRVLNLASRQPAGGIREPEDVRLQARYGIHDDSGTFVGRVILDAQPVVRRDDVRHAIILQLTARSAQVSASPAEAVKFFDLGHESVVRTFKEVTTPAMHNIWGYEDE
jgi:uncharacterized protein (TIGR04255 family)